MKQIEVVAAVIIRDGCIFATQRGYGDWKDWWEFPGGKMEPGETPEAALAREIQEELNAEIVVGDLIDTVEWDYPAFHLTLHCYWCELVSRSVTLLEHESAAWLDAAHIDTVRWLPADESLVAAIKKALEEKARPDAQDEAGRGQP